MPGLDSSMSPGLTIALTGLLVTAILFVKDWLTHRSLVTTLTNLKLNAEIAVAELAASKETDIVQAEQVKEIKDLSVQTHTAVNSQRDKLEAQMAIQKAEFESTIALLRSDLEGIKNLHTELLVQREKDRGEAATQLLEAKQSTIVTPTGEPATPAAAHAGPDTVLVLTAEDQSAPASLIIKP